LLLRQLRRSRSLRLRPSYLRIDEREREADARHRSSRVRPSKRRRRARLVIPGAIGAASASRAGRTGTRSTAPTVATCGCGWRSPRACETSGSRQSRREGNFASSSARGRRRFVKGGSRRLRPRERSFGPGLNSTPLPREPPGPGCFGLLRSALTVVFSIIFRSRAFPSGSCNVHRLSLRAARRWTLGSCAWVRDGVRTEGAHGDERNDDGESSMHGSSMVALECVHPLPESQDSSHLRATA
jgi:hypothetical protein